MANTSARPNDLPDFRNPPLNEVVLGIQFNPLVGYQQIHAGEIWGLFRKEFPKSQEHPPIAPLFETFGLPTMGNPFGFITGAPHSRFWFLRPDEDELIQFQPDRLLHNWRKVGDETNEYPRFESMVDRFRNEVDLLVDKYLNGLAPQDLTINQCEVSYINHIVPSAGKPLVASDWFRFLNFGSSEPDDFTSSFREVIVDADNTPQGRLICEASIGVKADRQRILILSLTVRGAPRQSTVESAFDFLSKGRNRIVRKFVELTTDAAHTKWERAK